MAARDARWRRLRLRIAVTGLASCVGAAAVLVSFITRTDISREPAHVPFTPALYFGMAGALAAAVMTWPTVRQLSDRAGWPNRLPVWVGLGLGFGILLPLLTGALLPFSSVLVDATLGVISPAQIPGGFLDGLFRIPITVTNHTVLALITAIYGGVFLGLAAWLIDVVNWTRPPLVAEIGAWAVAAAAGAGVVVLAIRGSPELLARLG